MRTLRQVCDLVRINTIVRARPLRRFRLNVGPPVIVLVRISGRLLAVDGAAAHVLGAAPVTVPHRRKLVQQLILSFFALCLFVNLKEGRNYVSFLGNCKAYFYKIIIYTSDVISSKSNFATLIHFTRDMHAKFQLQMKILFD